MGKSSPGVCWSWLFPAPALDDSQSEKQEKQGRADAKDHQSSIHDAASAIVHLVEETKTSENLRLPAVRGGQLIREHAQQEKARAQHQANHRGGDLAARQR